MHAVPPKKWDNETRLWVPTLLMKLSVEEGTHAGQALYQDSGNLLFVLP